MKKRLIIKRTAAALCILFIMSAVFSSFWNVSASDDDRYKTVILHSGKRGFFGDPSVREKESLQFIGDVFSDRTVPDPVDDTAVFMGWSDTEDASEANVFDLITYVDTFGKDLYAVWSETVYVTYTVSDGYLELDGQRVGTLIASYSAGSKFRVLEPKHLDEKGRFVFDGWYTAEYGEGTLFTEETVLRKYEQEVKPNWRLDDSRLMALEENTEYRYTVDGPGEFCRFIPSETDVYRIFTYDFDQAGAATAYIRMLDEHTKEVDDSDVYDLVGNTELIREMEAGKTYYLQIREGAGGHGDFSIEIERHNHATVTFHANAGGKAFFDGDPSQTEKQIEIPIGEYITTYGDSGLEVAEGVNLRLIGWSIYEDAETIEGGVKVDGPTDVYAVYDEYNRIILNANGGYFLLDDRAETIEYPYTPGQVVGELIDPRIDDVHKKFVGWATTKDADVPDIFIGEDRFEELPETIYAVYGEKVLVTFLGNGGYFLGNPNRTVFTTSAGKGRIFYGMAAFNADTYIKPAGWYDQNGVFIPYTSDYYNGYILQEDSVFTTVWERELSVYGNGGYIKEYGNAWAIELRFGLEDKFSMDGLTMGHDDPYMEFLGFATDENAIKPDIQEGVTPVSELTEVYAVWKNTRYEFVNGENAVHERGSGNLRIQVRNVVDDTETFDKFHDLILDGFWVNPTHYELKRGSVIIDLEGKYLDKLSEGEHNITLTFEDGDASTTLTVKSAVPVPDDGGRENPKTGVPVFNTSVFILTCAGICLLRRRKN